MCECECKCVCVCVGRGSINECDSARICVYVCV